MHGGPAERASRRARFEEVAVPLMKALFNGALRLTHERHTAEDLVQEAYLRAYRTFDGFTEGTNAKAWLFTILYSVFVNRYRRQRREPESLPPDEFESALARASEASPSTPETLPASEEVKAALARLPEDFRAAVVLVDLHDLSYDEAAGALGCKVGTLRSRLFRARKLLFAALMDHARELGYVARALRSERPK